MPESVLYWFKQTGASLEFIECFLATLLCFTTMLFKYWASCSKVTTDVKFLSTYSADLSGMKICSRLELQIADSGQTCQEYKHQVIYQKEISGQLCRGTKRQICAKVDKLKKDECVFVRLSERNQCRSPELIFSKWTMCNKNRCLTAINRKFVVRLSVKSVPHARWKLTSGLVFLSSASPGSSFSENLMRNIPAVWIIGLSPLAVSFLTQKTFLRIQDYFDLRWCTHSTEQGHSPITSSASTEVKGHKLISSTAKWACLWLVSKTDLCHAAVVFYLPHYKALQTTVVVFEQ